MHLIQNTTLFMLFFIKYRMQNLSCFHEENRVYLNKIRVLEIKTNLETERIKNFADKIHIFPLK